MGVHPVLHDKALAEAMHNPLLLFSNSGTTGIASCVDEVRCITPALNEAQVAMTNPSTPSQVYASLQ